MAQLQDVDVFKKGCLNYIAQDDQKKIFKPWLSGLLSIFYDRLMQSSVFPKTLNADINEHFKFLEQELKSIKDSRILELATGSGNAIPFLHANNQYTGIDVSPGLLKQAHKRLLAAGFTNFELYVTSAEFLPFQDEQFDACLCLLSLNFFSNIDNVIQEVKRLLVTGGFFFACVPVPERKTNQAKIHGTLYSEQELKAKFEKHAFQYQSLPYTNGSLLYFKVY